MGLNSSLVFSRPISLIETEPSPLNVIVRLDLAITPRDELVRWNGRRRGASWHGNCSRGTQTRFQLCLVYSLSLCNSEMFGLLSP